MQIYRLSSMLSNEIHKLLTHLHTFYMYNEQNCLQIDALSFLSFVPVTTEHAKVLYKLRFIVDLNAKGTNTTPLELPGRCRAYIVGDTFAANSFKRYFSETRKCRRPVFSCTTLPSLALLRICRKSGIAEYSESGKYSKWP